MDNDGGGDENPAIEIGEQELGGGLVAVEAGDAEVFGTDLLDAGMEGAFGFADGEDRWAVSRATLGTCTGHEKSLPRKWIGLIPFLQLARW
jgi:hypothetical protein